MKISTPKIKIDNDESVYEPAEDSYLMLDALESELDYHDNVEVCLEIGCGSGILSAGIASVLKNSCFYIAVDVNEEACKATKANFILNDLHKVPHEVIKTDCISGLADRLKGKVDLLICNPPYVATSENEAQNAEGVQLAWAGGNKGRNLTDKVIEALPNLLNEQNGVCLMIVEQCNDIQAVKDDINAKENLSAEEVLRRKMGRELLAVLKIVKK